MVDFNHHRHSEGSLLHTTGASTNILYLKLSGLCAILAAHGGLYFYSCLLAVLLACGFNQSTTFCTLNVSPSSGKITMDSLMANTERNLVSNFNYGIDFLDALSIATMDVQNEPVTQ